MVVVAQCYFLVIYCFFSSLSHYFLPPTIFCLTLLKYGTFHSRYRKPSSLTVTSTFACEFLSFPASSTCSWWQFVASSVPSLWMQFFFFLCCHWIVHNSMSHTCRAVAAGSDGGRNREWETDNRCDSIKAYFAKDVFNLKIQTRTGKSTQLLSVLQTSVIS